MNWKDIIGSVAPVLGTALGGPLGGLVASIAGRVLLGDDKATPETVKDYILANQSPDTFAKLKQIEADVKLKLAELEVDLERIAVDDRKDSRKRASEMNDRSPVWIGVIILIVWGGINFFLLTTDKSPVIAPELVGRILGMVDSATLAFLYWLYGSSKGSLLKTSMLGDKSEK
jgi:hypothetical protein